MEPHEYNCCCDTKKREKKNCFAIIASILAVALGVVIGIIIGAEAVGAILEAISAI